MSFAERIGLSDVFQTTLLVVVLLLSLAPYVPIITIGGVQLTRLDRRQRRALRIAGPLSFLFVIALVLPLEAFAPPRNRIEILAADITAAGDIDLAIWNAGVDAALLTRIEIEVLVDRQETVRPALATSARYTVDIKSFEPGSRHALAIRHAVPAKTIERIVITPRTNRSMRVRVHVHVARGGVVARDVELWP